jgi:hypothetical protein
MVRKIIVITQLQVEMSERFKQQLKQVALDQNVTLKYLVLEALTHRYPQLQEEFDYYVPRHTKEKEYL